MSLEVCRSKTFLTCKALKIKSDPDLRTKIGFVTPLLMTGRRCVKTAVVSFEMASDEIRPPAVLLSSTDWPPQALIRQVCVGLGVCVKVMCSGMFEADRKPVAQSGRRRNLCNGNSVSKWQHENTANLTGSCTFISHSLNFVFSIAMGFAVSLTLFDLHGSVGGTSYKGIQACQML